MATDGRAAGAWSFARLQARALAPVDGASLAALRVAFGLLMMVAVGRFFAHGWIREYFLEPRFFFKYWGFGWVRPWQGVGMYVHFAALGLLALLITVGLYTRAAVVLFTAGFAYAHLIDKTNYLNHYVLVAFFGLVGATLPWHRVASLDALRAHRAGRPLPATVPAWALWAARAQLGIVYLFGGLAKLRPDWLLHAQPLKIWLGANTDFPVLGPFFDLPEVAFALSWAGALFDLSVVWLLLAPRTRRLGYAAVLCFHLTTARLFHIGLFPWLMMALTPVFFDPSWPRRVFARAAVSPVPAPAEPGRRSSAAALIAGAVLALQVLLPLRHCLYPGNALWTEEGFRFSFNVMLMEKDGTAEFRIRDPRTGQTFLAEPGTLLTRHQQRMMASQPDMVLELAQALAEEFRRRGVTDPEVRVDAFASLNGRPHARLIDPLVDLARERDGLGPKPWILPAPGTSPP